MKKFTGLSAAALIALLLAGCCFKSASVDNPGKKMPLPGIAGSSADSKVNAFFDVGPMASDIKLPADQVYPRGAIFPFSFYSTGGGTGGRKGAKLSDPQRDADQEKILKGGATMVGPQYELNFAAPKVAAKYKKAAVYTLCPVIDGVQMQGSKSFDKYTMKTLPREKIIASLTEQVKAVANDPSIAWWDITPEELRWWNECEAEYARIAVEVIRANDPLKRPVMMYEPGHRDGTALAKLGKYYDFIAKGMYTNYYGWKNARAWNRYSMMQEAEARRQLNRPELTLLALPEMFQEVPKAERKKIPVWVRHDVYSALVSGAQGVLVFSARRRVKFESHRDYLEAYLTVARELTGEMNLGQVLLFGKPMKDLSFQTISGPKEVQLKKGKLNIKLPAVAMANIAFNRLRYVIVVNSSPETVTGMISGTPYGSDIAVSDIWSSEPPFIAAEGEFEVELPPWGVKTFVIYRDKNQQ